MSSSAAAPSRIFFVKSSLASVSKVDSFSSPGNHVGVIELAQKDNESQYDDSTGNQEINSRTLCILEVPSFMIPGEILHFFGAVLSSFASFQILQHHSNTEKYLAIIITKTEADANRIYLDYNDQSLSSLENVKCKLFFVRKVTFPEYKGVTIDSLLEGEDGGYCPVCLEPLNEQQPRSFSTACNHTFHIDCIAKLEGTTCPVCRFQHDSSIANLTECFVCGYAGQNVSPDSINSSPHCVDLWVCLICGFTGCGESNLAHIRNHYEQTLHTYAMDSSNRQRVWDFAGDGYVHRLILNSEESVAEASSSNNISSQSRENPSVVKVVEIADPRIAHDQLDNNRRRSGGRSQVAPLSSEEEELLINRKLEQAAFHYNQQLAWQLHHMRTLYQSRLHLIQQSAFSGHPTTSSSTSNDVNISVNGNNTSSSSGSSNNVIANSGKENRQNIGNWRQHLLSSLQSERSKLLRLCEASKERLSRGKKELEVLQELSRSLSANEQHWKEKEIVARRKFEEAEATQREEIAKLEKKVAVLMEQLDCKASTSSSTSSSSSSSSSFVSKL